MRLIGRVETAKVGSFGDIEISVVDKEVKKPGGTGRPQYTCKIVSGLPGLDEVKQLRKDKVSPQELFDYVSENIALPQEDDVIELTVIDVRGKDTFKTLVCEIALAN